MSSNNQKLALVLLAAGNSRRMGSCKQLLPWKNSTLIEQAIEQALQSKVERVYVVLGANRELIQNKINIQKVHFVYNDDWMSGMGGSISQAVKRVVDEAIDFHAVLITLADQPLLDHKHYNSLINKYIERDKIVTTQFEDSIGVPAVFPKRYFMELMALQGAKGAKSIIQLHLQSVAMISEEKAAVDLDTLEEYQRCFKQFGQ